MSFKLSRVGYPNTVKIYDTIEQFIEENNAEQYVNFVLELAAKHNATRTKLDLVPSKLWSIATAEFPTENDKLNFIQEIENMELWEQIKFSFLLGHYVDVHQF